MTCNEIEVGIDCPTGSWTVPPACPGLAWPCSTRMERVGSAGPNDHPQLENACRHSLVRAVERSVRAHDV